MYFSCTNTFVSLSLLLFYEFKCTCTPLSFHYSVHDINNVFVNNHTLILRFYYFFKIQNVFPFSCDTYVGL